jgi:uncharacterized protein YggE
VRIVGEGKASVRPDMMALSAGVVTTGATAAAALGANNEQVARLLDAVRNSGIAVRSLKTANLEVRPRFAGPDRRGVDDDGPARIVGFVARNTLNVELDRIATAGPLVSLMFEAGANEIAGPRFAIKDPSDARRKAERAAILDARAQADNYAAALGMKVARLARITDSNFNEGRAMNEIVVTGSRIAATPIEPGEVEVKVTVSAEFQLEPR